MLFFADLGKSHLQISGQLNNNFYTGYSWTDIQQIEFVFFFSVYSHIFTFSSVSAYFIKKSGLYMMVSKFVTECTLISIKMFKEQYSSSTLTRYQSISAVSHTELIGNFNLLFVSFCPLSEILINYKISSRLAFSF